MPAYVGRRLLVLLIVLMLLPAVVAGCGGEREAAVAPDGGRIPVYVIADATGDWGFPNPYTHYERGPGYIRMSLIFETLVWKDAGGMVPALAESWRYDEDENSYTFVLRDDVAWHDGQPFTADDVLFTFEYLKEHPYPMAKADCIEAVTAEGNEVTFKLSRPYAPFLEWVAGTIPILPRHIWQDVDHPEDFRAPESAVGTGPFRFGDYNKEQGTYLYLANDDYYGGKVMVEELRFVKVAEEMTAAALRSRQVNAGSIRPEVAGALDQDGYTVMHSPYYWNAKLMINHTKAPLSSREMRQALAYAIDREELVAIAKQGEAVPGSAGLVPPDSEWFAPNVEQYPCDPARTSALLEELGYVRQGDGYVKDGKPLELELIYSAGMAGATSFTRDAEMLKTQLERAGFKISLRNMEAKTVDDRILNWDFDLALSGHGGLGGDPEQINQAVIGKGFNSARYEANAELVDLMKKQVNIMDHGARLEAVQRVQELYAADLPALTLYYPKWYFAHDGTVDLFYTPGGVALGVPIAINRMVFVES